MAKFNVVPRLFKSKVSEGDGVLVAKKSGLRMVHWWGEVFAANSKYQATDSELMEMVHAEFPGRLKAGKAFQSVGAYRSYYNQGLHGTTPDGQPPKTKSVRYGDAVARQTEGGFKRESKPAAAKASKPAAAKASKPAAAKASNGKASKANKANKANKASNGKASKANKANKASK